jgi:transposase InsO family protein
MSGLENSGQSRIWEGSPEGIGALRSRDSGKHQRPQRAELLGSHLETIQRWACERVDPQSAAIASKSGELLIQGTVSIGHLVGPLAESAVRKLYLQTVVDAHSGLAFAKVYTARSPFAAVDILEERVLPFYEKYGVRVEEIETAHGPAYCGRLLAHPYEWFLKTSGIKHRIARARADAALACLDAFQHVLREEFLVPELRRRLRSSVSEFQAGLDAFVENFNRERPMRSPGGVGRTPYAVFCGEVSAPARAG